MRQRITMERQHRELLNLQWTVWDNSRRILDLKAFFTMGFKWHFISAILYVEILVTVLLLLPWIPPQKWSESLTSSRFQWFVGYTGIMCWSAVFVLIFVFGDAFWRQWKCRSQLPTTITNTPQKMILSTWAEIFRAQRNLHISGFVLLLAFVNYRLADLLIKAAHGSPGNRHIYIRHVH